MRRLYVLRGRPHRRERTYKPTRLFQGLYQKVVHPVRSENSPSRRRRDEPHLDLGECSRRQQNAQYQDSDAVAHESITLFSICSSIIRLFGRWTVVTTSALAALAETRHCLMSTH